MATIKSYTDLEQSKKLKKILPLKSADMVYVKKQYGTNLYNVPLFHYEIEVQCPECMNMDFCIPAWSLSALISIIPQEIFDGEYIINITEGCDNKWILTYDHHENRNHSYYGLSTGADNLVDACTDIIIKLKERNII